MTQRMPWEPEDDQLLNSMRNYAQPTPQETEADGQPTVGPINVSPGGPQASSLESDGQPTVGAIKVSPGVSREQQTAPSDDVVGPIRVTPAPKTEVGMARYEAGLAREAQGQALENAGRHAIQQGEQEAGQYRAQAEMAAKQAQEQDAIRARFDDIMARKAANISQAQEALSKQSIDPGRYLANMSGGEKVLAAIGIILSGIGGGMLGTGRNVALEEIHHNIDRDIDAQKANYEHGVHRIKGLESDYSMARERGLTDFEARRLIQNQSMNAVSLRLKEAQAQGAGVAKNDLAQEAIQDLDAKAAANNMAIAQQNQHQAASQAHAETMQERAHQQRMEEIMLQGAMATRGEKAADAKANRDEERQVTKYGLEQKKLDKELDPKELQRMQEAEDKGGKGLSYLGGVRALVDTEARENRNTAARIAENWLRSKTGAAASDREREYMTKIQTGRATEAEYKDFLQRMQGFREQQQSDLEGSFNPEVRERFEANKPQSKAQTTDQVAEARRKLGITGPK